MARLVLGLAGLALAHSAILGVSEVWQANPWAELGPVKGFFGRSLVFSIPAVPVGLVLTAVRPSLWPLPLAALIWTISATALVEPSEFDFVFEYLLQSSSGR